MCVCVCVCVCTYIHTYTQCTSMVGCLLMLRWSFGLIPHGGPTELFLVPVCTSRLV